MAKRKTINDKLRFEVFKRDSFKCQYCGRSAPEVVLHVDHIVPVSKDGTNEITNLITACCDCNLGKGARKLDDQSTVEKQRKQLEELQERRSQIEMMAQWKLELDELDKQKVLMIINHIQKVYNLNMPESYNIQILKLIHKYGFDLVLESMDITAENCPDYNNWMAYAGAVCRNKTIEVEKPYYGELLYIRAILSNRFGIEKNKKNLDILDSWIAGGDVDIGSMKEYAVKSDSIQDFLDNLKTEKQLNKDYRECHNHE